MWRTLLLVYSLVAVTAALPSWLKICNRYVGRREYNNSRAFTCIFKIGPLIRPTSFTTVSQRQEDHSFRCDHGYQDCMAWCVADDGHNWTHIQCLSLCSEACDGPLQPTSTILVPTLPTQATDTPKEPASMQALPAADPPDITCDDGMEQCEKDCNEILGPEYPPFYRRVECQQTCRVACSPPPKAPDLPIIDCTGTEDECPKTCKKRLLKPLPYPTWCVDECGKKCIWLEPYPTPTATGLPPFVSPPPM